MDKSERDDPQLYIGPRWTGNVIIVNLAAELVDRARALGCDLDKVGPEEGKKWLDEHGDAIMRSINAIVCICQKRWPTMADVKREVCPTCTVKPCVSGIGLDVYMCCEGMRALATKD